jgi:hypothetical protein
VKTKALVDIAEIEDYTEKYSNQMMNENIDKNEQYEDIEAIRRYRSTAQIDSLAQLNKGSTSFAPRVSEENRSLQAGLVDFQSARGLAPKE